MTVTDEPRRFEFSLEELDKIIESAAKRATHDTAPRTMELIEREHQFTIDQIATVHARIDTLATKDDIKEVLEFMKAVNTGVGILRFSWNNAAKIGSFLLLLVAIWVFFKHGISAMLAWVFNKVTP